MAEMEDQLLFATTSTPSSSFTPYHHPGHSWDPLEQAQEGLQGSLGAIRGSPEVSDTLPSYLQQQISLLLQLLQV